jgi:hypothetical protein
MYFALALLLLKFIAIRMRQVLITAHLDKDMKEIIRKRNV